MTQALYRRWRPQTWDEVIGQEHVVQTLRNAVRHDRWVHAYLLAGPRGTGKTTVARLLAKAANCLAESPADRPCNQCEHCRAVTEGTFLDLIEIDAASNTSVEDVRDLRDRISFRPNQGRVKFYIIDEVHMLSMSAFNALLKTLEEPPEHARFVLATTEVHKVPATVLSRCQRHEFRRIPVVTISEALQRKCAQEGLEVEPGVLDLIARQATGSLRDAISLLDQLTSTGEAVSLGRAQQVLGTATSEAVRRLVRAIADREPGPGLMVINTALDAGADPRQLARQVVEFLRGVVLTRLASKASLDVAPEVQAEMAELAQAMDNAMLLQALHAFQKAAAADTRGNWQPALPLEMALIEACADRSGSGSPSGGKPAAQVSSPPATRKARAADPPPPPARGAPASSAEASASGPLTFGQVRAQWPQVLATVFRRDPRTQALLNSGRPLGIERGALVLGFTSDLLRERMERKENLALVGQCLEEVRGVTDGALCSQPGLAAERGGTAGDGGDRRRRDGRHRRAGSGRAGGGGEAAAAGRKVTN